MAVPAAGLEAMSLGPVLGDRRCFFRSGGDDSVFGRILC